MALAKLTDTRTDAEKLADGLRDEVGRMATQVHLSLAAIRDIVGREGKANIAGALGAGDAATLRAVYAKGQELLAAATDVTAEDLPA
jgi:hypothetical protein